MNWTPEDFRKARETFATVGGGVSVASVMDVTVELLAARGGTLTAEYLSEIVALADGLSTGGVMHDLLAHAATQGAALAELSKERDEARTLARRLAQEREAAKGLAQEWETLQGEAYRMYREAAEERDALRAELARLKNSGPT
jgi:Zn-dependent M32 family carboxypeptidase